MCLHSDLILCPFAYLLLWLHFSRFCVETSKSGLFEIVSFIKLWVCGGGGEFRRMNWTKKEARVGWMINSYKIWYENPKGKGPLRRPGCRCKGNVKMDFIVIDLEYTRWFKYDRDWFVCKQAALHSSCAVRLVYIQISPGHIWTTLYELYAGWALMNTVLSSRIS